MIVRHDTDFEGTKSDRPVIKAKIAVNKSEIATDEMNADFYFIIRNCTLSKEQQHKLKRRELWLKN